MIEIIVAHYNDLHFEETLTYFKDHKITIYDKSNKYTSNTYKDIRPIENIGREGETYIRHIIENYDSLSDYTVFIQDDTGNHIIDNKAFYNKTVDLVDSETPFHIYEVSWRSGGRPHRRMIRGGYSDLGTFANPYSIRNACQHLGIDLPEAYITFTCAFLIVHKDRIRSRPKEFYIKLREWILEHPGNVYALEHMWAIIF